MDDELTPEQKFAAEDPETLVPRALMQGRAPDAIVDDLMRLDWSLAKARSLVARVQEDLRQFNLSPESRQRLIDAALKQFIGGFLSMLGGILLFLAGFMGGVLFYGMAFALFFGGIVFAGRGWARWRFYRHLASHAEVLNPKKDVHSQDPL